MKLILSILVMILPVHGSLATTETAFYWTGFTFGPVFNLSFGKGDVVFSGGANVAYWDYKHRIPWSIDIGYERNENSENVVYTELQSGEVFAGGSAGVVYNSKAGFGMQGSVWADALLGGNLRFRYLDAPFICAGVFLSIPKQLGKARYSW